MNKAGIYTKFEVASGEALTYWLVHFTDILVFNVSKVKASDSASPLKSRFAGICLSY